jgi:hypothetical protein
MGSPSASTSGNTGSDAFVNKKSKVKPVKRDKFGYTVKENPVKKFISGGGVIGAVTKPLREKTEAANRKFYEEKVVPAGKSKAPNYETYMKNRLAGKTDAYGNPISQGDNGGAIASSGKVVQAPTPTAPTTSEVSQATTAVAETPKAKEDDILLRKRKAKARGRSPTILTGVTGVTGGLTLGIPSLLGR